MLRGEIAAVVVYNEAKSELWGMNFTRLSRQIFMLFVIICAGCTSLSGSSFYFTGDETELLIGDDDLPPQWKLETTGEQPLRNGTGWTRIYTNSDSHDRAIISTGVTIFERQEDAIEYWTEFEKLEKGYSRPPCINPPNIDKSDIADQFEAFCADEDGMVGIFAYDYFILARYGNVVTTFSAVAVNEPDMTVTQASEAGVLRWTEMEALLKRIDEKFEKAGKVK